MKRMRDKTTDKEIRKFLEGPILKKAIKTINGLLKGRAIYLVGGTIRDIILKRNPLDFDFAVEGKGIEVASLFSRAVRGKFVLLSEEDDEARVVKKQKGVTFDFKGMVGGNIHDDLADRDFTINAIAFGPLNDLAAASLFDPFCGLVDIKRRILRTVSSFSLQKDPLRILRAIRFALELNFRIDKKVWEEGRDLSLRDVARERIAYEFLRILACNGSFPYIKRLIETGICQQIFPTFSFFFQDRETLNHSLLTYKKMEAILSDKRDSLNRFFGGFKEWEEYLSLPKVTVILKLASLFHDLAKPLTREETKEDVHFYGHDALGARLIFQSLKKELRLPKKLVERVARLVLYHMRLHLLSTRSQEITERAMRRFLRDLGEDAIGLMAITCADGYATAQKTQHLKEAIKKVIAFKVSEEEKKKIKRLVTGYDLIDLGLKPGPIFKKILDEIYELTLEGKIKRKEEGIEYVKKNYLLSPTEPLENREEICF